jgi:hypothetical protein
MRLLPYCLAKIQLLPVTTEVKIPFKNVCPVAVD